ncbi:MAG: glucokinase [Pseudomonadota bacterium]
MADPKILVGDVGGTHARFALADAGGTLSEAQTFEVQDFKRAEDALEQYISAVSVRPTRLCIASAGKRRGDEITLTNAHWVLGEAALTKRFGLEKSSLVNDFEALALGAASLPADGLIEVQAGARKLNAPRLCLGPGTGFGQAVILPGTPAQVIATEGGFRLLPVRTERDQVLYRWLEAELGRTPILEEALSGRGLVHLLGALRGQPLAITPPELTAAALAGPGDEREAVRWFFEILATAAADACLMTGAWGGVLIGGGVVPRLASLLDRDAFSTVFARPCQMQGQLKDVPIHIITDGTAALRGAAAFALQA